MKLKGDYHEISKMVQLLHQIEASLLNLHQLAVSPLTTSRMFESKYQDFVSARDAFWSVEADFSRNLTTHRTLRPLMKTISSPLVITSVLCESEIASINRPKNIPIQIENSIAMVKDAIEFLKLTLEKC